MASCLKVLLSAYACEPGKGSEPGVGWNQVMQTARFHEVWVITRKNNRAPIESALSRYPKENIHWVYYDLPSWARFWKRGQRGVHLYYHLWQVGVYLVARRLHRDNRFDLVHHVTFANYWMPSLVSLLPLPFLWGPVGGSDATPRQFMKSFRLRGRMYEWLRNAACWIGEHNPAVRLTAKNSTFALATTPVTKKSLQRLGAKRVEVFPESGMARDEIEILRKVPPRNSGPFRFVSIGRLLHWKGFHLSLKAFALFSREIPDGEYWFIGDGPERKNLERLATDLKVTGRVRFLGNIPRPLVLRNLSECDVLVHPSLHDSGGWVCLEAMAAGRPVICLDLGGPSVQVTAETGIKVPAEGLQQTIMDLKEGMTRLAGDRNLLQRMSRAARLRVEEYFNWNRKGEWMTTVYNSILDRDFREKGVTTSWWTRE